MSDPEVLMSVCNFAELHSEEIQPLVDVPDKETSAKAPVSSDDKGGKQCCSPLQVTEPTEQEQLAAVGVVQEGVGPQDAALGIIGANSKGDWCAPSKGERLPPLLNGASGV